MILSQGGALIICDKIMEEKFRAVLLQYRLLKAYIDHKYCFSTYF
jgi:hypothetical protein